MKTDTMGFTAWASSYAPSLDTLDPRADLGDLDHLLELAGDARVVAIGESAHYVREYYRLRHRVLRLLTEHAGFSTVAWEAPFTEAHAVDAWVQGGAGTAADVASTGLAIGIGDCPEMHELLEWLRDHNRDDASRVRFAGIDAPGSGGSPMPALRAVREFLSTADPDAVSLLDDVIAVVERYHDADTFNVLGRYAGLDAAVQDEVTAQLSYLLSRMDAMSAYHRTQGRQREHATALAHLRGAWHVDHLHRDVAGRGLPKGSASRDAFMAERVLRMLDEGKPGTRIVVAAHNCHIQKTPTTPDEGAGVFPAGYHLAEALGDDYVAIAATSVGGRGARIEPAFDRPRGFRVHDNRLPDLTPDAVETALATGKPGVVADLRAARQEVHDAESFRRIRMEDYFSETPVFDAFDAVVCLDETTCIAHPGEVPTPQD